MLQSSLSVIGTVYLSSDATNAGYAAKVEWPDFWRMKKVHTPSYALDGSPYINTSGVGAKGPITLVIPSCPSAVYSGLKTLVDGVTKVTTTLNHPQLGTKSYTTRVVSLLPAKDAQYIAGDPIDEGGVTVRLVSYGLAP